LFASVGAGLGSVSEAGRNPDLSVILRPAVIGPLVALAVLAMLPVAWRHWRAPVAEFDMAVIGAGSARLSVTYAAARLDVAPAELALVVTRA